MSETTELTTTSDPEWFRPKSVEHALKVANFLAKSEIVPKDYRGKPNDVMVCLMYGAELGLGAMAALQGISVINGRPSVWGDSALAIVQQHPDYIPHREWFEGEGDSLTAYAYFPRKGGENDGKPHSSFTVADAKKAGLWGKQGPWTQYPKRMLQMRARGFAIRDRFADALRGVILREEAEDIRPAEDVVVTTSGRGLDALKAQLQKRNATVDETAAGDAPPQQGPSEVAENIKDAKARQAKKQLQAANREAREDDDGKPEWRDPEAADLFAGQED